MKNVYIIKAEIATGLGDTLERTWNRLIRGECAIDTIKHFRADRLGFPIASSIRDLWRNERENRVCTLMEPVLDRIMPVPQKTFVIWTGIKGNAEYIESGQEQGPPFLPMHYRRWVEDRIGISGAGLEINAACASSTVGLAIAAMKIACGECSACLVAGADLVTKFVHTGFSALKALTATACRPFDKNRDGLVLGDGAAAVLLGDEETAYKYNAMRPVRITGWGISNDAIHITGPARDGRGLIQSIHSALSMADVQPDAIAAFCAHGTGTIYNDGMEMTALASVFGDRSIPVFSVKGAIGHTLGAAGAVEAAIGLRCLQEKVIPPTVGLEIPEERVKGQASAASRALDGEVLLTTNSGFGGVNAALLLSETEK